MSVQTQTPAIPGKFQEAAVRALSGAAGDPDWLLHRRLEALSRAQFLPAPTREQEAWRRTDPARFRLDRFVPAESDPAAGDALAAIQDVFGVPEVRAALLVTHDGAPAHAESSARITSSKAAFTDFRTAARQHGEALRSQMFGGAPIASLDRWAALNAAFVSGGAYLRVPKGVVLEDPVWVFHRHTGAGRAVFLNSVIHLEEGASATLVEVFHGDDEATGLLHAAVDARVENGASLRYLRMQELGGKLVGLSGERLRVYRDARADWSWGALGSGTFKSDMAAHLVGEGSSVMLNGFYHGRGTQHLDHHTFQDHQKGQSTSDLLYKGALSDRARSVYMGLIKIHKDAQRSDAYQANRNLILSSAARADSIPSLEIEANDVRCTHGATMGQLDEEQLFYMRSRGLTRDEAAHLLVEGFYEPVFDRIGSEALKGFARARLLARLTR